ncbi:MAG: FMN-binding protein [Candidatus Cloacimonetes bacterium]|nr:FMN-binding protein [Candidatus Cloacimonadota bacterium]
MSNNQEKLPLNERKLFPVFFILILSVIFITVLAIIYTSTQQRVENFRINTEKKQILNLFNLPTEDVSASFEKHVKLKEKTHNGNNFQYYEIFDRSPVGYVFKIRGNGLWGKIDAFLAVDIKFRKIIGFDIISQNETPGLGARITEDIFKNQFNNKIFVDKNSLIKFSLVSEETPETQMTGNQIKQITGATSSSNAVVKMIYEQLKKISVIMGTRYKS